MNDPIVEEVRRVRDEYAARFDYDLDAIYRDLKEQEKRSGRTFVNYGTGPKKPLAVSPTESEAPAPVPAESETASPPHADPLSH